MEWNGMSQLLDQPSSRDCFLVFAKTHGSASAGKLCSHSQPAGQVNRRRQTVCGHHLYKPSHTVIPYNLSSELKMAPQHATLVLLNESCIQLVYIHGEWVIRSLGKFRQRQAASCSLVGGRLARKGRCH